MEPNTKSNKYSKKKKSFKLRTKRSADMPADSEEKYRLIFENSPLGIFHFDGSGNIADCNDKFIEIIGSSRDALRWSARGHFT